MPLSKTDISTWRSSDSRDDSVKDYLDFVLTKRDAVTQPSDVNTIEPVFSSIPKTEPSNKMRSTSTVPIQRQSASSQDALERIQREKDFKGPEQEAPIDGRGGMGGASLHAVERGTLSLPARSEGNDCVSRCAQTAMGVSLRTKEEPNMKPNPEIEDGGSKKKLRKANRVVFWVNKLSPELVDNTSGVDDDVASLVSLSSSEAPEHSRGRLIYERRNNTSLMRKLETRVQRGLEQPRKTETEEKTREKKPFKSSAGLKYGIYEVPDNRRSEKDARRKGSFRGRIKRPPKRPIRFIRPSRPPAPPSLGEVTALLFDGSEKPQRASMYSLLAFLGGGNQRKQGRVNTKGR